MWSMLVVHQGLSVDCCLLCLRAKMCLCRVLVYNAVWQRGDAYLLWRDDAGGQYAYAQQCRTLWCCLPHFRGRIS